MDTDRWKSILVPREVYEEIKALSKKEGRTIGGQLRLVFEWYMETAHDGSNGGNGTVPQKTGGK
jgi:predicted DNA-binding protein